MPSRLQARIGGGRESRSEANHPESSVINEIATEFDIGGVSDQQRRCPRAAPSQIVEDSHIVGRASRHFHRAAFELGATAVVVGRVEHDVDPG